VDGCRHCGGVWFDRGELARLAGGDVSQLAAIDRAFEAEDGGEPAASGSRPCPVCGIALASFEPPHMPGLSLTGCPAGHGTWLGEDDFERVLARVEEWRALHPDLVAASSAPGRQRSREVAHMLLSQPCPHCGQPNANTCPVCWACGSALIAVQACFCCPWCRAGLASLFFEGIRLNYCLPCGALWLDHGELGALLQLQRELLLRLQRQLEPPTPFRMRPASGAVSCPACHLGMLYSEYGAGSGIFVHSCDGCRGLWLEHSALAPIQQFALAHQRLADG
jgi:Zn-finger nucleic acid-binding protein